MKSEDIHGWIQSSDNGVAGTDKSAGGAFLFEFDVNEPPIPTDARFPLARTPKPDNRLVGA